MYSYCFRKQKEVIIVNFVTLYKLPCRKCFRDFNTKELKLFHSSVSEFVRDCNRLIDDDQYLKFIIIEFVYLSLWTLDNNVRASDWYLRKSIFDWSIDLLIIIIIVIYKIVFMPLNDYSQQSGKIKTLKRKQNQNRTS